MESHDHGMHHMMQHKKIANMVFLVLLVLAGFLFVKMIGEVKAYSFIGGGVPSSNTITVSGEGEALAVPDTALFSFGVTEEAKTVALAQDAATKKTNIALKLLENAGVDEKDIKTTAYNIYPQYDYIRSVCNEFNCPPGKQELRGYEVSQMFTVKVRDTKDAGKILAEIGSTGVTNVSGLTFTVDDEDEFIREARKQAIEDAQEKAKQLAKDLNVTIVRVVSFSENGGGFYPQAYDTVRAMAFDEAAGNLSVPELPVGENTITSNVNITYEIR